ncbi:putative F-box domain, leucine-rich repeat domain superfamily, F-box-like domain superfamily [Arabidopsis thaliana]
MLPTENPTSSPLSDSPEFNQSNLDSIISSLVTFPDSPSLSISSSFDRVLDNLLSSCDVSVQDQLVDRTLERLSLLLQSTKRCSQKLATLHNSISWFLPSELTVKVFSMVDTKSLMQASTCCTMFNTCAMDPLCYSHIDLTKAFKYVDDRVLHTLLNRSGKQLRSLKLGRVDAPGSLFRSSCLPPLIHYRNSASRSLKLGRDAPSPGYFFTRSCLDPLKLTGNLLTSLHIYFLGFMNMDSLSVVMLESNRFEDCWSPILELLARKCCLIEHLFLDNCYQGKTYFCVWLILILGMITYPTIKLFVTNCLKITSLTLLDFRLNDAMAQILVTGFRILKYINLSNTAGITGSFLRDLGHRSNDSPLQTLILRDCFSLQEREVVEFLNSLIAGNVRSIRYIDVSSNNGLACDGDRRTSKPNFTLEKLKEERLDITFVADFPSIRPSY